MWVHSLTYPSTEQASLCLRGWRKKDQLTPYLAVSPLKLTLSLGERETVFGTAWLHFLPEWTLGPKGTPRQICMPLAILCYLLQIYYCGKLLPQQQLRGLFKSKWYLQAVRRYRTPWRAHTHKDRGKKLHQKVIMEIRIQLSSVPNGEWCLWWSVGLFRKQRNFSHKSLLL